MEHLIILLSKAFKCQFVYKSNIVYSFLIYVIPEYNHLHFFLRQKVAYMYKALTCHIRPQVPVCLRLFLQFLFAVESGHTLWICKVNMKMHIYNIYKHIYSCRTKSLQEILDRQQSYSSIHTQNYIYSRTVHKNLHMVSDLHVLIFHRIPKKFLRHFYFTCHYFNCL